MPAFGDAPTSAEIEGLNYLWELDSTPADAICSDGKRYTIVVGDRRLVRAARGAFVAADLESHRDRGAAPADAAGLRRPCRGADG